MLFNYLISSSYTFSQNFEAAYQSNLDFLDHTERSAEKIQMCNAPKGLI